MFVVLMYCVWYEGVVDGVLYVIVDMFDWCVLIECCDVQLVVVNDGQDMEIEMVFVMGMLIDGMVFCIFDDGDYVLVNCVVGEVVICGMLVMFGYLNFDDGMIVVLLMVDGWFCIGDIGYVVDGQLYIFGCKKEVIIICGSNYFLYEIEEVLVLYSVLCKSICIVFGLFDFEIGIEWLVVVIEVWLVDVML